MIDPELRRRVKDLELRAMRLVSGRFMGEWASNLKGQGLEFRDLREYVPGDDIRRLDWKATARTGRPHLRQFTEERQQSVWFALDLSASMTDRKGELARRLVATLAWASVKQGDPFGFVGFTDRIEMSRPSARGETQLWATIDLVANHSPASKGTDFSPVWEFFLKSLTARATIVLVSDFSVGIDKKMLAALALRHEVLAFQVIDPRETGAIPGGLSLAVDGETGERRWVDFSSTGARSNLSALSETDRRSLQAELRKSGVWYREFYAGDDFLPPLLAFFHRRREVLGA